MNKKIKYYTYKIELSDKAKSVCGNYYILILDGIRKYLDCNLVQFDSTEALTYKEFKEKLKGTNGIISYDGYFRPEYILTQVIPETKDIEGNTVQVKLEVSQDVIDFLDSHHILWDDNTKYYKINNILYRLDKQ